MYLGVDIGLQGGLALIDQNGKLVYCEPMPTYEIIVNKKNKNQYDINEIYSLLKQWNVDYPIQAMATERLRAIPNQSSQTGFSLGFGQALFRTLSVVLSIPINEIEPPVWQKEMFKGVNYGKNDTKVVSIQVAKKLAPTANFKPNTRCKKDSDGLTDAYLIACYLRKQYGY